MSQFFNKNIEFKTIKTHNFKIVILSSKMDIINWYIKKNFITGTFILCGDVEIDTSIALDPELVRKRKTVETSKHSKKQFIFVDDEIKDYKDGIVITRRHKYKLNDTTIDRFFQSRKAEYYETLNKISEIMTTLKEPIKDKPKTIAETQDNFI
jgi:hypothetical protein